MKIYGKFLTFIAVLSLGFVSCNRVTVTGRSTIPFVENLLTDSASVRPSSLASYEVKPSGSVTIIGPVDRCMALSEMFLRFDQFDNIDGSQTPDQLPDFAGETIASIMDFANAPYDGYVENGNTRFLRELSARNVLMATQSTCAISPFDHEGIMAKAPAKVIVYASPYYEEFGKFDVDTLFTGKNLPVLTSTDLSTDSLVVAECYKLLRSRNLFTHTVSQPKARGYITYPVSGLDGQWYNEEGGFIDNYKYSRADNTPLETYVLLGYSDRYLSAELAEYFWLNAPHTYSLFVQ